MFRLGLWIAQKLGRGLYVAEILTGFGFAAAMVWLRPLEPGVYPRMWLPIAVALLLFFLQLSSKLLTAHEKQEAERSKQAEREAIEAEAAAKRQARDAEMSALVSHKRATAGNLASLLRQLVEGKKDNKDTHALKISFLRYAVDTVMKHLNLERSDDRITATWTVPVNGYTEWEVVAYDRNHTERQPHQRRPIATGIPGAPEAFLTGSMQFIPDTQDERHRKHFPVTAPYRTILSIPARAMNVSRGENVVIENQPNAIIGVLNIDCRDVGILVASAESVVRDFAYLIAILEHLEHMGEGHV